MTRACTWHVGPGLSLLLVLFSAAGQEVSQGAEASAPAASAPASDEVAELTHLPGFGVLLPPPPPGFNVVNELGSGMLSGTVAAWQRDAPAENDAPAPHGAAGDEDFPSGSRVRHERIILIWRPIGMHFREGVVHAFRESASNPTGSVRFGEDHFALTAREVEVPHPTRWPTLRFERPDGTPDRSEAIIRTEAVATNNLAYVFLHVAPRRESPEG